MRSFVFNTAFGLISTFYIVWAALASLSPSPDRARWVIAHYVRCMVWAMRVFAGFKLEVRGRERLPDGAFILAPKHASYGDGFSVYAQFDDLAFVTGDHLERFPLFKTVLKKLGAIVVDHCGGPETRNTLNNSAEQACRENRKILIYPEGSLAPVGVKFKYHAGVYHMARDLDLAVVRVASSLGWFWPQEARNKRPGTAVLEFLQPMTAGNDEDAFMAGLESAVEECTAQLVAEASGRPVTPAVFVEKHPARVKT